MKELSIEEKAKAYNIVREKIAIRFGSNVADEIFSQFEMSEDERIRKGLIAIISDFESLYLQENYALSKEDAIAWLENQSTSQVRTGLEWVNTIDDACDKRYLEEYAHGEYCHEQSFKWGFQEGVDWLEKQGEQKPNPCDGCINRKGCINCENGELRETEQKPVWSEEDENYKDALIGLINEIKSRPLKRLEDWDSYLNWLKSLRPQNRWKPSDEQMQALSNAGNSFRPFEENHKVLWSLYNDLKKLRESSYGSKD